MTLRKFLIWIRDKHRQDPKNLYFYCTVGFLVFAIISVVVDTYVPWDGWWMMVRSAMLFPLIGFGFVGFYSLSLDLNVRKQKAARENEENWVPYRLRYSPKWRRNVSLIIGALMLVVMYAADYFVGYTIFASVLAIIAVGMVAFCRLTRAENRRAEQKVPDPRDSMFEERMKQYERAKKRAEEEKNTDDEHVIHDDDDDRVVQSAEDKNSAAKKR